MVLCLNSLINISQIFFLRVLFDGVEEYWRKRDAEGYDSRVNTSGRMKAYQWMAAQAKPHLTKEGVVSIDLGCCTAVVDFEGPAGLQLQVYRGVQAGGRISGWLSEYYGERMVRPTVEVSGSLVLPAKITTRISFSNAKP